MIDQKLIDELIAAKAALAAAYDAHMAVANEHRETAKAREAADQRFRDAQEALVEAA